VPGRGTTILCICIASSTPRDFDYSISEYIINAKTNKTSFSGNGSPWPVHELTTVHGTGESVALLVARRTNNRKVASSRPTKVVCITVLTGNRLG